TDGFSDDGINLTALKPILIELNSLLNEYNSRVIDIIPTIKQHLTQDLQEIYHQLEEKADNFEFDESKQILIELEAKLGIGS
ncbi:MAG: hypothetical protein IMF12_00850, partial [Proteobacteria bacterium]|nr:hypothetical protein [Pseudomonadota bacterium]